MYSIKVVRFSKILEEGDIVQAVTFFLSVVAEVAGTARNFLAFFESFGYCDEFSDLNERGLSF